MHGVWGANACAHAPDFDGVLKGKYGNYGMNEQFIDLLEKAGV